MIGPVLIATWLVAAVTPLPARTERFVYDTASVIDDATERQLELRHQELFDKTGVAIVVLTVPRLVDETIDELAVRAGQRWGVGRKGEDRGLVLALSRTDRQIFVATGYGTEGYLPDGRVGALLDTHALPALRQDRFSDGIAQLSSALVAASAREFGVTLTRTPAPSGPALTPTARGPGGIVRIFLLVLAIVAFAALARRHPLLAVALFAGMGRGRGGAGFGGGVGTGGFGGGGFGGGGAGRGF